MLQAAQPEIQKTVDHLFRHEAGKMVAVLTRLFGFPNIDQAEDIVHDTMLAALETWKFNKIPENPQAWLYFTAKNKAIDLLRRNKVKSKAERFLSVLLHSEYTLVPMVNEMFNEHEIRDNQLRMMFACCHPSVPHEAQVMLILKTLCGLNTREIANAFLAQEDAIQKRIYRTKEKLRTENISLEYPGAEAMPARVDAVLRALYLLFNEGYHSSHPEKLIREDLCEEAMRLTMLLTENTKTNLPYTYALLALMCFHVSRFNVRMDDQGLVILLKDQDRVRWNTFLIKKGNEYLKLSASGGVVHEFHIEAAIASEHANATSYETTNWGMILTLYNLLYEKTGNPMVALNKWLVTGETGDHARAIKELEAMKGLENNCYYNTSLGEMYMKTDQKEKARASFKKALSQTTSFTETELINRKLQLCK